jgi:hypothetical protein
MVFMSEDRSAEFYRGRAGDMRRQADRAISPHLRETYIRIADEWQRMAQQAEANTSSNGSGELSSTA